MNCRYCQKPLYAISKDKGEWVISLGMRKPFISIRGGKSLAVGGCPWCRNQVRVFGYVAKMREALDQHLRAIEGRE